MPKMNLLYGHVADGRVYGHGHDVEVPEHLVELLTEREEALAAKDEDKDTDPALAALFVAEKNPVDEEEAKELPKDGADQRGETAEDKKAGAAASGAKPKAQEPPQVAK
jgi:hypothetical protein